MQKDSRCHSCDSYVSCTWSTSHRRRGGVCLRLGICRKRTVRKSIPQQSVFNAATETLREARPTAVNLAWAVDLQREMYATLLAQKSSYDAAYQALLLQAQKVDSDDLAQNKAIAKHGAALFDRPVTILTHCNAGALATAGIGTALGVIRELHLQKTNHGLYG